MESKKVGIRAYVPNKNLYWDEFNYTKGGIGGSEVWAIRVADILAERGYDVYLFGNPSMQHVSKNGVRYLKPEDYKICSESVTFDYFILSRQITDNIKKIRSKKIYLMLHDGIIINPEGNGFEISDENFDRIDKVCYLSEFHKGLLLERYNIPDEKFQRVSNGIDFLFYDKYANIEKKNKMVCSSGKNRECMWLIKNVFPLIKREVPDFEIDVCGYSDVFDEEIFKQGGINIIGDKGHQITKSGLAKAQSESKIWIYCNHGYDEHGNRLGETFSITAIEDAYAGCACILGKWGPFIDTLNGYSGFICEDLYGDDKMQPMPKENTAKFAVEVANMAIKCLKDEEYREKMAKECFEIAKKHSWEDATDDIERLWGENTVVEKKDDDVAVYVLSLKDYVWLYKDDFHKQLQVGACFADKKRLELTDDTGENISSRNHVYSETTGVYWIWKNALDDAKYVGHENHRRHFNLSKDEIKFILKNNDIILPRISEFKLNMDDYYKIMHNHIDLLTCEEIIKERYPEYSRTYDNVIKAGKWLYCADSYITTSENYARINEFIFDVLFEMERRLGLYTEEAWEKHVSEKVLKVLPSEHEIKGMTVEQYQKLVGGFLYERLLTVYVRHNFKKIYEVKMEMLEEEYNRDNMRIMLCSIGRQENRYIREFVEFYKTIGVTNICLFDNNRDGEDDFRDEIGDLIDSGFVILKDYRNLTEPVQLKAYNECYNEYKDKYDWFLFFDIDEFFFFNGQSEFHNLNEFLSQKKFNGYEMIHVNWLCYGDNGQVHYEDKPLTVRFSKFLPLDQKVSYDFPENFHIKSIIRGGIEDFKWEGTVHTPTFNGKCCDPDGKNIDGSSPFNPFNFKDVGLRHFCTKSTEEYANKVNRGFCDGNTASKEHLISIYFKRNEVTQEKIDLFKEMCGVDMNYLLGNDEEPKGHNEEQDVEKDENIKIYSLCFSQKEFDFLNDRVITPLQVGADESKANVCKLKDNTGDNISSQNYFYVENTGTYWIWKNVHGVKYKGQMQYRRPLDGINENFDFESAFADHDVITCEPFNHPANKKENSNGGMFIEADTVEQGYAFSNCGDDLSILEIAISIFFPEYKDDYVKYIKNGENLYYSNGFIMREADYDRYCEFLFKCLEAYLKMANINSRETLYEHVKYNMETGKYQRYMNGEPLTNEGFIWQTRIGGFLSERIWTLWLLHNFSEDRIYKLPYVKMEENMYT